MAARVVIEWTRTTLRLALSEGTHGRFRVRALQVEPLGPDGEVAQVLGPALKQLGARTAKAISVIPRDQVMVRLMTFPTVQPVELAQMVELTGKAQLPYPKEQVVLGYQLLEQREGSSTVTVVACRRDTIERRMAPLRAVGLQVESLTVSSWGVLGWYGAASQVANAPEPVFVIHVDEERVDLVLIRQGRLLLSRALGPGVRLEAMGAEGMELLAQEVDRSVAALKKELPGTDVRSLLLTGTGPLELYKQHLADRFQWPVTVEEPLKPWPSGPGAVDLSISGTSIAHPPAAGARARSRNAGREDARPASSVVVGGIACLDRRHLVNLNPPELILQARHRQQVRELALVGILWFFVLGMGGGLAALQVWRQQRIASQIEQAIAQVEPMAHQVQAKQRVVRLVSSVLSQRRQLATVLAGVFRVTPASVALEGLTIERDTRRLMLRGHAASTQQVLAYLEQLEQLEGVVDVRLKHSIRRSTPAGQRMDFELVVQSDAA